MEFLRRVCTAIQGFMHGVAVLRHPRPTLGTAASPRAPCAAAGPSPREVALRVDLSKLATYLVLCSLPLYVVLKPKLFSMPRSQDGYVLLGEMQIQHPTASMIARAASAQAPRETDKKKGLGL